MAVCWAVLIGVWAFGALYNARYAPAAIKRDRNMRFGPWLGWIVAAAGVVLLQTLVPKSMWTAITFRSDWLAVPGLVLLICATLFTLWARWTLGRMWSYVPSLREHHELHTTGPYRFTRHPIYTGLLGMLLGTALVTGFGGALVGLLIAGGVFLVRTAQEEKLMLQTFGEQYSRYQREVPRLVPFLRI
ncbi:MAG TPA: isoprenylcysteine carboxylmethyltransferase family protein [Chloroflexota bacterium]|nr:isoprenylcysteine carboxylmethyltransferase family protein [Chloroflexota bacterium]